MFPSEFETRQMTQSHLKGGVAPSRNALARQTYLERQKQQARLNAAVSVTALFRPVASRVAALFTRNGAFWSASQRAPR